MGKLFRKSKHFWVDIDEVSDASFEVLEHLPILSEMEGKYKAKRYIRTVYFDTPSLTMYNDYVSHSPDTLMYRLTWYNVGRNEPVMEKVQFNFTDHTETVYQYTLTGEEMGHIINRTDNIKNSAPDTNSIIMNEVLLLGLVPVLMVENDRRVYANPSDTNISAEIDSNLRMTINIMELGAFTSSNNSSWGVGSLSSSSGSIKVHSLPLSICRMLYTQFEPVWVTKFGANNDNIILVEDFAVYIHAIALLSSSNINQMPSWLQSKVGSNDYLIQEINNEEGGKTCFSAISRILFPDKQEFSFALLSTSKSFFTNERTFIQWANATALLAAAGASLIAFFPEKRYTLITVGQSLPVLLGIGYCTLALIMIIYSYIMFNIRMKNLSKSGLSPSVYASKIGPTFMSVFTILLLIVTFVLDYNI